MIYNMIYIYVIYDALYMIYDTWARGAVRLQYL